jgi:hypothetical protein
MGFPFTIITRTILFYFIILFLIQFIKLTYNFRACDSHMQTKLIIIKGKNAPKILEVSLFLKSLHKI